MHEVMNQPRAAAIVMSRQCCHVLVVSKACCPGAQKASVSGAALALARCRRTLLLQAISVDGEIPTRCRFLLVFSVDSETHQGVFWFPFSQQ